MKVTIKKWGGDDELSWAVFVNGVVVRELTGLNRAQARHFRQQIIEQAEENDARFQRHAG